VSTEDVFFTLGEKLSYLFMRIDVQFDNSLFMNQLSGKCIIK
jgi:hypothetical protein